MYLGSHMHKWYVIQVLSSHEKKVKKTLEENLESQGMEGFVSEVLLPTEQVAEVKSGEQKVVERRLWPGYLFVKMELNDDSWMFIKNSNGVIDFLGGGAPEPLSDHEVDALINDLRTKKEHVAPKHAFDIGDRVKINHGVFASFEGVVEAVDHERGRLTVLVTIFGRDTKVDDLEFWQVEEVQGES